jgi:hypothetical protein
VQAADSATWAAYSAAYGQLQRSSWLLPSWSATKAAHKASSCNSCAGSATEFEAAPR